jgi:predicted TIM-barrel fold metal-dependent hydrolase
MILDGHIHLMKAGAPPADFSDRLERAGIAGGVVMSLPPATFKAVEHDTSSAARLKHVLAWRSAHQRIYPFFWIDPLESDAVDQVGAACAAGIAGFKIICDRFYPGNERAMGVYRAIAESGRPILFHAGILWDGKPSSTYNRPAEFEALLAVPRLRFALAHMGWPWCDELFAVFGKFQYTAMNQPGFSVEMFIDLTPGTPPIYRRDALTKLYSCGYDVQRRVLFGSDCLAEDYNVEWVRGWLQRDEEILRSLGLSAEAVADLQAANLERFLGLRADGAPASLPRQAM